MIKITNLSFSAKIVLIVLLALLPIVAITLVSVYELNLSTDEQQMSLIENNYDQAHHTLEEKMLGLHAISTLMTVNEQVNTALRSASKEDIRQQLSAFDVITSHARNIEMSHDGTGIYLFVDDDYIIAQDRSTRYRALSAIRNASWFEALINGQGHPLWVYTESLLEKGKCSLTQVRMLMDHNDYTHALAVLAVALDEAQVQGVLSNAISEQYMAICNDAGDILTDNGCVCPLDNGIVPADTAGVFVTQQIEGKKYYLCGRELSDSGLYLISILPRQLMTQEVRGVQNRVLLSYLVIFLMMALILLPMTGRMVARIRQLGRQLAEVPTRGLRKLKPAMQQDEIGQLISAYNTMVDEMENMLATQYDLGRAKAGAELKALQSQINPHFLYNTLDMVSWMAKKQETEKIQQVMVALSQFYKLTLSGGRDIITLEEELRLCDAYMRIQQLRWEGAIDYLVEVDDALLSARLPKITLQPLIENAIKHGIMQRGEARGSIIISAVQEESEAGNWMTLSVLDNGVGMENSEEVLRKGSVSHYGMKNIEQRLALFYDAQIQIRVDSETGLGTCVSMMLPIVEDKEGRQA